MCCVPPLAQRDAFRRETADGLLVAVPQAVLSFVLNAKPLVEHMKPFGFEWFCPLVVRASGSLDEIDADHPLFIKKQNARKGAIPQLVGPACLSEK